MENTFAIGLKPTRSGSENGSGVISMASTGATPVRETAAFPTCAMTPAPARSLRLPVEPEPTQHAGGISTAGLPNIGDIVLGFRIVEKLGQGGFGSVFLGEQVGLADRPVALKFTSKPTSEPERLANLQHTNVVPVYSVHSQPPLQVLCMPYRGRHTLADAVREIALSKALPATGAGLLSTTPRAMEETRKTRHPNKTPDSRPSPKVIETPQPIRDMLVRLSFPESVVWLISKLADGLAHAHERGIVHLDLKPANVLITDDGMPMILDFGLAHDFRDKDYSVAGGTVRYMSPEQLNGFLNPEGFEPDPRMDLYSLGVMFYELLSGHHPFGDAPTTSHSLPMMLASRRTVPPRVTTYNRQVAPAVASIVAKLLQPDPADRYQTAAELFADLTCHQESRPLRYAGNPSVVERVQKFRRRHPVGLTLSLTALFAVATFVTSSLAIRRSEEKSKLLASDKAKETIHAANWARIDLSSQDSRLARLIGLQRTTEIFSSYGILQDQDWADRPDFSYLASDSKVSVRRALGEMAILAAYAEEMTAVGKNTQEQFAALERAKQWNRRAAECYSGMLAPPTLREQAERLASLSHGTAPERPAAEAAVSAIDYYVRGITLIAEGKYTAAVIPLEQLVDMEPGHSAGQHALAQAYQAKGRFNEALERFQLAKALSPKDARPAFQRGVLLLNLGRVRESIKEFDTALERDPQFATCYYHRGIALQTIPHKVDEALADFAQAEKLGESAFRCIISRAKLLESLPDRRVEAQEEWNRVKKVKPQDETDYLIRAHERLNGNPISPKDPDGALRDYEKATQLNPRYLNAWLGQAVVFAELKQDYPNALRTLNQALELAPEFSRARSARAVLLARLGKRAEAIADIESIGTNTGDSGVRYQIACAYALTARQNPNDKKLAIAHFITAMKLGFEHIALVESDPDLDGIRDDEDYLKALEAAKAQAKY